MFAKSACDYSEGSLDVEQLYLHCCSFIMVRSRRYPRGRACAVSWQPQTKKEDEEASEMSDACLLCCLQDAQAAVVADSRQTLTVGREGRLRAITSLDDIIVYWRYGIIYAAWLWDVAPAEDVSPHPRTRATRRGTSGMGDAYIPRRIPEGIPRTWSDAAF